MFQPQLEASINLLTIWSSALNILLQSVISIWQVKEFFGNRIPGIFVLSLNYHWLTAGVGLQSLVLSKQNQILVLSWSIGHRKKNLVLCAAASWNAFLFAVAKPEFFNPTITDMYGKFSILAVRYVKAYPDMNYLNIIKLVSVHKGQNSLVNGYCKHLLSIKTFLDNKPIKGLLWLCNKLMHCILIIKRKFVIDQQISMVIM